MGLCPDCSAEGETVTYVGASKSDIVNGVRSDETDQETGEDAEEETAECDLCGDEYPVEDGTDSDE